MYRTRFPGQFFDDRHGAASRASSLSPSLPRGLKLESLHEPMVVVPLAELLRRLGQLLQLGEVLHPKQLFLEGAEESLDAAVALRVAEAGPETETFTLDRSHCLYGKSVSNEIVPREKETIPNRRSKPNPPMATSPAPEGFLADASFRASPVVASALGAVPEATPARRIQPITGISMSRPKPELSTLR